jgi:hypothetical protein
MRVTLDIPADELTKLVTPALAEPRISRTSPLHHATLGAMVREVGWVVTGSAIANVANVEATKPSFQFGIMLGHFWETIYRWLRLRSAS